MIGYALLMLPGLVIALTVHECAHALSAKWLGDRNPERMGRISLNPFRHLSLMGTLAIFLLGFGWGKPVEVNIYNFKRPKVDYLLSSLAGPFSNIILCLISLGLMHLIAMWHNRGMGPIAEAFVGIPFYLLMSLFLINAILAVINLIPIPPLDGSKIWPCIFPGKRPVVSGKWSMVWLAVLLIALYTGMIDKVLSPTIGYLMSIVPDYEIGLGEEPPENWPADLVPPSDAQKVDYEAHSDPKGQILSYGLVFELDRAYPAKGIWDDFESHLKGLGWRRLHYQLTDPNLPAQKAWVTEPGDDDSTYLFLWKNNWVGHDEAILTTHCLYSSATTQPKPSEAMMCVWRLYPTGKWPTQYLTEYQEMHPEEFEELPAFVDED